VLVAGGSRLVFVCASSLASILLLACGIPVARAEGDANQASCPNEQLEGFSARLADCRAYEMVTPPYKQGYPVFLIAVSTDGGQVYGRSLGNLAGTEGAPQSRRTVGALYRFLRTPGGWVTVALSPANPEFRSAATLESVSADSSRALFQMPTGPVGQDDYYLRYPDGSLVDVGPATPPEDGPAREPAAEGPSAGDSLATGASADMSHLVFAVTSPFGWPGDATLTGAVSLYEYSGTGNSQPAAVAVTGGPGSTTQIGHCGVSLGGPHFTTRYNAVSTSGDAIVFTPVPADESPCELSQPAHAELYVRIAASRTVLLSAPQCDPEECPVSTATSAIFSGASGDGVRGWFLSTQRLTRAAVDDATPGDTASGIAGSGCQGAAGSGCNLYEYDLSRPEGQLLRAVSAGGPRPHVDGVVRISADGSHVYFVATGKLAALPGPGGSEPEEGAENLYVSERSGELSRLRFVAALSAQDSELWGGATGSDESRPADTTPDGTGLVFASVADLTPDDTSSVAQIFEFRDGPSPTLRRVSIGEEGFNQDGNSDRFAATLPAPDYEGPGWYEPQARAIDAAGETIVFASEDPLTPGAGSVQAGAPKIYEYRQGHVYLIYAGTAPGSRLDGVDATGGDVFFQTSGALVSGDTDTQTDIYDARVDGGLSEPGSTACSGESCLGAPASDPSLSGLPGSALGVSEGNFAPSHPSRPTGSRRLTRAQKLSRALRACRHERPRARRSCTRKARRHFGKVRR